MAAGPPTAREPAGRAVYRRLIDPSRWDAAALSHRPRRISYRRRLAAAFLLRYAACLSVATPSLIVVLAGRSPLPILGFALLLYPACGYYLHRYLFTRVIWLSIEPARRIGEAGRAMLLLWPLQGARFLRELRPRGCQAEALSAAE